MKWYTGGIAEAITYSKSIGAIFVVYIEGTDEHSQKISELIENGRLGQKLEQDGFVAIKLESGSVAHRQFSEIYKKPSTPSIYLFGKSGVPLDIITGKDNLDNVTERIDKLLVEAKMTNPSVTSLSASTNDFLKAEQASGTTKVVCDDNVCTIVDDKSTEDTSSKTEPREELMQEKEKEPENNEDVQEISAEEKVERAKELIELKRKQKEEEEKENERQKELERRKMGQSVQQLKKWQEDQELKQLKEERDREKRENQQARERVLAQIAQDKAERMSRSQSSSPQSADTSKNTSSTPPKQPTNKTRLQFKLPDGSSTTREFENSDLLETVVHYIRANLPLPFSNFTLSTVFPRREFKENDYSQTLSDLQLSPTAVILVLPVSTGPISSNSGGTLTALIWTLLAPIFSILDYFKRIVFGSGSSTRTTKRPPPDEPTESQRYSTKRKPTDSSSVIRRQGNIHRLSDKTDSDDENNTWNGNSTQQM